MTLQEFIPYWNAQPFRPFQLHTTRGVFPVAYPLLIGMTPTMEIMLVIEEGTQARAEIFPLDQIQSCENTGKATDLATLLGAIAPETLARNAQLLTTASASRPGTAPDAPRQEYDAGTVTFHTAHAPSGVFLVHATVHDREGEPIFSTRDTRWNLHGVESFENGTSLYLHHLDHPTVEQRIILWPPDRGTFESFSEARSAAALTRELRRRDTRLARKPARTTPPTAAYLRRIHREFPIRKPDGKAQALGENPEEMDPKRFQLVTEPRRSAAGEIVRNPLILDQLREAIVLDLTGTDWHTTARHGAAPEQLELHHGAPGGAALELSLNLKLHAARIDQGDTELSLSFIQRHLANYFLYEPWSVMYDALVAGPCSVGHPDVVLHGAQGFRAEMWAGDPRYQPPFLQPHFVDAAGRTLLDLRGTTWAGWVHLSADRPEARLRFVSGEREKQEPAAHLEVSINLLTHRVRCPSVEGSTSLGMLQAMVRHVRGVKWLHEELPQWLEKGRRIPQPQG